MDNPYQSPDADSTVAGSSDSDSKRYGGIGRFSFALILFGLISLTFLLTSWADSRSVSIGFPLRAWIFLAVLAFVGVLPRTRNIGMHPAKALLIFMPIANLILGIRCLAYQEGYEATKKLDKTGKVIAAVIAILAIVGYGFIFISDL
jgi:hypothetical protein